MPPAWAQSSAILSVASSEKLIIKRGATAQAKVKLELQPGFHVNSNTPADAYLIPLKLTWAKDPLQAEQITYPKPQLEKYAFSVTPVSVFSGSFEVLTRFRAPQTLAPGLNMMSGKLRYQACNNKECFPPRAIDVHVTLDVQ